MPDNPVPPRGEILLYQTEDGQTRVECRFADETLWLSQALIAELFRVTVPTVNEHLRNLYEEGELAPEPTIRRFRIVRREGSRAVGRDIEHCSLDTDVPQVGIRTTRIAISRVKASSESASTCATRALTTALCPSAGPSTDRPTTGSCQGAAGFSSTRKKKPPGPGRGAR